MLIRTIIRGVSASLLIIGGIATGQMPEGSAEMAPPPSTPPDAVAIPVAPEPTLTLDSLAGPESTLARDVPVAPVVPETPVVDIQLRQGPPSLSSFNIPGLENRVNLQALNSWDVVDLIEFLAHRGGLKNIVIGKGVAGLTTKLKFDDVSVGDALEVILSVNNLAYTVKGGIITIMSDAEYQLLFGTSFLDQKKVKIIELKFADAPRVASMLEPIKSSLGKVVSDKVSGTLILVDTPAKIQEMEAVAKSADIATVERQLPTVTRTFVLQNAEIADIQAAVTPMMTPEIGNLRVDARTRALIVTDLPHKIKAIEDLMVQFDRRSKQVFIEAKIVQVTLVDNFSMGVNWDHVFEGINPRMRLESVISPFNDLADGSPVSTKSLATTGGTTAFKYSTIAAGGTLNAVIQALESMSETKLLSNPHIAVVDGEKATINVVTDEVYSEAKLETGTTNVVGETFNFVKVGVTLDVTPRINDEDMISMTIRPEISSVLRWYKGAIRNTDGVPVVRRSVAETSVLIKNNETIIIAGMIENFKSDDERRVPLLGRIPLLGVLFKQKAKASENRELIVFLTPRIVSGEQPYLRMKDVKKDPKPLRPVLPSDDTKKLKELR